MDRDNLNDMVQRGDLIALRKALDDGLIVKHQGRLLIASEYQQYKALTNEGEFWNRIQSVRKLLL